MINFILVEKNQNELMVVESSGSTVCDSSLTPSQTLENTLNQLGAFNSSIIAAVAAVTNGSILSKSENLSVNENSEKDTSLSLRQQQLQRYNYKCKYCLHFTKYKAHIIEHMMQAHKINLMQCPDPGCSKKFKDEWKLKRHLLSTREHKPMINFRNLNDIINQHVDVSEQKSGFPCPLCQVDMNDSQKIISSNNNIDQNTSILNLINKNTDNYLYLDTYEELREHLLKRHTNFSPDSYFICKQCGQVFINRLKLSCHVFNVHSGKRKKRNSSSNQGQSNLIKHPIKITNTLLNMNLSNVATASP